MAAVAQDNDHSRARGARVAQTTDGEVRPVPRVTHQNKSRRHTRTQAFTRLFYLRVDTESIPLNTHEEYKHLDTKPLHRHRAVVQHRKTQRHVHWFSAPRQPQPTLMKHYCFPSHTNLYTLLFSDKHGQ